MNDFQTTLTGHQGLRFEEALIFEQDSPGASGVDVPTIPDHAPKLGGLERRDSIGLPGLSEPQVAPLSPPQPAEL